MSSPFIPTYGQYTTEVGYGEGAYNEDGYDSITIIRLAIPRPTWTAIDEGDVAFGPYPLTGPTLEVGYDEGGFGEDGYDTQSILKIPQAMPSWSKVTTK